MDQTTSTLILCGTCCVYPAIVAGIAVFAYRRYQQGGWRAVIFGERAGDQ